MEISIRSKYSGDEFTVTLNEVSKNEVTKFRKLADEIMGLAPEKSVDYVDTSKWTKEYLRHLMKATRLFYESPSSSGIPFGGTNKINTIKFVRVLTNPTLDLKSAKDFVEYVTELNAPVPAWVAEIEKRDW